MAHPRGPTTHRIANYADPPRGLGGFAWTVISLLIVLAVLYAIAFIVELAYIGVLDEYLRGTGSVSDVEGVQAGRILLSALTGLVAIAAAGFFIAWTYRAYMNLRRTSVTGLRFDPGWAIGAWFIPIFNWIRPKQMIDDVWRAGETGVEVRDDSWRRRPVSPLLHWWWGLWVGASIVGAIAAVVGLDLDGVLRGRQEFQDQQTAATIAAPSMLFLVAAAILACVVVRRITERDDRLREAVFTLPVPQPPASPAPPGTQPPPPPAYPPAAPTTPPPPAQAPAPSQPPPTSSQPPGAGQPPPPSGPPAAELPGGLIPTGEKERVRCAHCGWVFDDAETGRRHVATHHASGGGSPSA